MIYQNSFRTKVLIVRKQFKGSIKNAPLQNGLSLQFGYQRRHHTVRRQSHNLTLPEGNRPLLIMTMHDQMSGFTTEMDNLKNVIQAEICQLADQTHETRLS